MKLQFLGAAGQVTGSCYYLEAGGARLVIDCGMFQEHDLLGRNWGSMPFDPSQLDALILTHAHLDHTGRVPRLFSAGYHGPIHTTKPTVDLVEIVLADAGKIQVEDAKYKRKRHEKEGRKGPFPETPLFDEEDVAKALPMLRGHNYGEAVQVADGVTVTFHDAGHILGSSMVEVTWKEDGRERCILFSGDIGNNDKAFSTDPSVFGHADYVVMESTYGSSDHDQSAGVEDQLASVINATFKRGGNVVIPTFAIERAQELMWHVGNLVRNGRIDHPPVFLDSPMAVDVTDVFLKYVDWMDDEVCRQIRSGDAPLKFPELKIVRSMQESMAINHVERPCIIMASSGMCTGGRIKHHLRQNLPRPESTILFVGYQAEKTLGREILSGEPEMRIHGRTIPVRAKIAYATGFSAHAGRTALLNWASHFKKPPKKAFLVHGELEASRALRDALVEQHGWDAVLPQYQQAFELR